MDSLVSFNHHQNQDQEHIYHPKNFPHIFLQSFFLYLCCGLNKMHILMMQFHCLCMNTDCIYIVHCNTASTLHNTWHILDLQH